MTEEDEFEAFYGKQERGFLLWGREGEKVGDTRRPCKKGKRIRVLSVGQREWKEGVTHMTEA